MSDLSAEYIAGGKPLPEDLLPLVDDAAQTIARNADVQKRSAMSGRLEQVRCGSFDVIVVRRGPRITGFIAVKPMGDGARLIFGHVLQACEGDASDVLKTSM